VAPAWEEAQLRSPVDGVVVSDGLAARVGVPRLREQGWGRGCYSVLGIDFRASCLLGKH
jgi:hypothetical protein